MLNARNKVVGTNVISVGSITSSPTFLREVFKPAITASASAVIIGHNHPSGTLDPSTDDMLITKKIIAVAKLLDIIVHDHVIVDMASTNY
jgi:DNA repair protein RadC